MHRSTLVTAGVFFLFLVGRTISLAFLALATLFFASFLGRIEKDGKRVVAFSTLSQISLLVLFLTSGFWGLALLHLTIHAFFKRLLFLIVGDTLSSSDREQNLIGGSGPLSGSLFLYPVVALLGLPFASGLFSKELMVRSALGAIFVLALASTYFYALRLLNRSIWPSLSSGAPRSRRSLYTKAPLSILTASYPALILLREGNSGIEKRAGLFFLLLIFLAVPLLRPVPRSALLISPRLNEALL